MKMKIRLKEIRKDKNISLSKLSIMTGISTTHLNDVENNLKSPSLFIIIKIAKALKVDICDLYIVMW